MLRRHLAIFFAAAMIALGGISRLHSAGDDAKAPKVDRQGDALPDGAVARMGTTRWRHGDAITFLAFPSDNTVLTAARDGVRLWDRGTGKEIRRFEFPALKAAPGNLQPGVMMLDMTYGRGAGPHVALTPDGKIFAAAFNNAIQLWDVDTGKEIRQLKGPQIGIADLVFSPNGKTLAITGNDRSIHFIKTENGAEIRQIKANVPKGPVRVVLGAADFTETGGLAFSHDGKILASTEVEFGQQNTTVYLKLIEIETGKVIRKTEIADGVSSIAFSPDGKLLAHGSGAKVILREADTGKEIRTLKNGAGNVATLVFSADSKTIASRGSDQVVRLWETSTGKSLHELGEPVRLQAGVNNFIIVGINASASAESRNLAFSRDGKTVGVGGGQAPRFFNVGNGKEQPLAGGHRNGVSTLAITPDGKTMISRGADQVIRRWNARTGEELGQVAEPAGTVSVAVSPDGKLIALANADNTIRLLSVETGKQVHKLTGNKNGIAALAFSADGKTLASQGSLDSTIRLFDIARGSEIRVLNIPKEDAPELAANVFIFGGGGGGPVAQGLAFSPDGASIASSIGGGSQQVMNFGGGRNTGPTGMIRTWDVATGKEARQIKLPQQRNINCVAYSPDGRLLAADNNDGTVSLWELASGKERAVLGEPVAANPRGRSAAVVFAGGGGFGPSNATAPPTSSIAFSADGAFLATRGPGNSVRVWEVASAKEAGRFKGHTAEVATLAFAPDGKTVASGSADTTMLVWDATRLKRGPNAAEVALSGEQVKSHWADLAGSDAVKAGQSIRALAAGAKEAVSFISEQLKPAVPIDPKKIEQWVTDLDSGNFQKRAKAAEELEKIGELARPALKKILNSNPSPETRRRVEPLLEKLITGTLNAEQLRLVRAVEALERSGSPESLRLLETLTTGAPGALPTREAEAALNRKGKMSAGK